MAYIETPKAEPEIVRNLNQFLEISGAWHKKHSGTDGGMLSELWYRGVNVGFDNQAPGVYRKNFTSRASKLSGPAHIEEKRLRLEREMISQFRTGGAVFLESETRTQIYFSAQHFGMPTRLLDWSTNPLAALLFACDGQFDKPGFVYAMNAKQIIPPDAKRTPKEKDVSIRNDNAASIC
jgi:hypothetical protein